MYYASHTLIHTGPHKGKNPRNARFCAPPKKDRSNSAIYEREAIANRLYLCGIRFLMDQNQHYMPFKSSKLTLPATRQAHSNAISLHRSW